MIFNSIFVFLLMFHHSFVDAMQIEVVSSMNKIWITREPSRITCAYLKGQYRQYSDNLTLIHCMSETLSMFTFTIQIPIK